MTRKRLVSAISSALILATVLIALTFSHAHATNVSGPDLSGACSSSGSTFNAVFQANALTAVGAWQINITYAADQVKLMNYGIGTVFSGTGGFTGVGNSTHAFLIGFSYNNRNNITTTSATTLVTLTFKTLVYHASVLFHIVLTSEDPRSGTMLLNTDLSQQSYTTTDGDYGCQL